MDTAIEKLISALQAYPPFNEQEACDKAELLRQLQKGRPAFLRESADAHMTASAWVVNPARDKALMVYHNIYRSWSWLGGHADGDADLLSVAIREVEEESGLCARPVAGDIFSIEILTVDGHEKGGRYVSSHLHLNVTYLLEADDRAPLREKPDENSGAAWFSLQGAVDASTEPWFRARIYTKLNRKLLALK